VIPLQNSEHHEDLFFFLYRLFSEKSDYIFLILSQMTLISCLTSSQIWLDWI